MIYLLHGENAFEKAERVRSLKADFDGYEKVDGEDLSVEQIRDLLQGQTLFSQSRLIIIDNLSQSAVWAELPELAIDSANTVIFLEEKVDKRTKTYKWLQKNANVIEFAQWTDRDNAKAVNWCIERAKSHYDFGFNRELARILVDRLGPDQLRLDGVLKQLELADKVNRSTIDDLVRLPKRENVFELFEAVLDGNKHKVQEVIGFLEQDSGADGAYQVVGLITSQLILLSGLVLGAEPAELAKDIGGHPFVIKKLASRARKMTVNRVGDISSRLGWADMQMKTTSVNPWLILETALIGSMDR